MLDSSGRRNELQAASEATKNFTMTMHFFVPVGPYMTVIVV